MAATLSSLLPSPVHHFEEQDAEQHQHTAARTGNSSSSRQEKELASKASASLSLVSSSAGKRAAPGYGKRKGWIPGKQEDYGDGGA